MNIKTIPVGEFQVNCSIIWGSEDQAIVIDPGGDIDEIVTFLEANRLSIAAYMMTHGHMDHITGLAALHERLPAPIGLHPDDASWAFTEVNAMPPWYGIPERPGNLARVLEDGQMWTDGGLTYQVITTPGHTPGGVCFYFAAEQTVIVGDTLFAGSVGRTDLPGGDSRTLSASLKRLAALPDDVAAYPGHGPSTTIGQEKRTNFFMQFPNA